MDLNTITSLIGSIGFPIVCCIFLWRFVTKTLEKLSETIRDNTIALQETVTIVKKLVGDDDNGVGGTEVYVPRLSKPEAGNPYYNRKPDGYSTAILGKPTDPGCNVLSNCVGYAFGRFNEISDNKSMSYLKPVNAERFMTYKRSLKSGMEPKLGGCMVWQKGATLSGDDGAGHVAIVEEIYPDGHIITSESGYGSKTPFELKSRVEGSGNWGQSTDYKYLGCIYQPIEYVAESSAHKIIDNMRSELNELEKIVK